MPQLQNLVLTDRAATPVAHTFTPRDIESGVATVQETNGVPLGAPTYSISLRKTQPGNAGKMKATVKFAFPIIVNETVNGVVVPKVARTSYVDATFTFEQTSSEAERNNVVGMFADSLKTSQVLVNDTLVKLQNVY